MGKGYCKQFKIIVCGKDTLVGPTQIVKLVAAVFAWTLDYQK